MSLSDQDLGKLTSALTFASRAYRAAADKVAADYGLSQATGLPVLLISRFGEEGVRPGVLAMAMGLEASSLVRVVDHLIASRLVERHEDPNDRRAKILRLTDEGRTAAEQMDQALRPFRRKLFGGFAPGDVEACLRVLSGLPAAIDNISSTSDGAGEDKQA
jgi:MarR family transcriptional regulator for hemolysin